MSTVITTPPLGLRLLYHTLGWRLDEPYRAWVAADLADPRWFHRHWCVFAPFLLLFGTLLYGSAWLLTGRFNTAGFLAVVVVGALFPRSQPDRAHRFAAARQGLAGTPGWWARLPNVAMAGLTCAGSGAALLAMVIFAR